MKQLTLTFKPRMQYILKYNINGASFIRRFDDAAKRDARADILATNGITVVCSARPLRRPRARRSS